MAASPTFAAAPSAPGTMARPMRRTDRGHAFLFTLLLVALLGVALVVVAELDSTLTRREREQALLQAGHEFRQALARYYGGNSGLAAGQYPTKLEDLLQDRRHPKLLRHLRRVYADPITGKPEWGLVLRGGRIVGVHSLSELTPIKQDGFDTDDAGFKGARKYRQWVFSFPVDLSQAPPPTVAASAPQAGFAPVPPVAP